MRGLCSARYPLYCLIKVYVCLLAVCFSSNFKSLTSCIGPVRVRHVTDYVELDDAAENNLKSSSEKEYLKESYSLHPFPETDEYDDTYEFGDVGPLNTDVRKSATLTAEKEDPESNIDQAVSNFYQEYEVFELRIVHRKNRFTSNLFFLSLVVVKEIIHMLIWYASIAELALKQTKIFPLS